MAILPIDSGRYGTARMLAIFDEQRRVDYQVRIEGAVAGAQGTLGIIPSDAAEKITKKAVSGSITTERIAELEAKSDHDTASLVEALAELCPDNARPWIHYGLTSNDLVDTSTSMQMRDALFIIIPKAIRLAQSLIHMAETHSKLPAVGRTHGQHASIISFGLKFANWAEEIAVHVERLRNMVRRVCVCKTLGVVGTGSLMGDKALMVQAKVAKMLDLNPIMVATQIVPRERYAEYIFSLTLLGSTLDKIALEIRNLQRTEINEVAEQFKQGQMGSSAVPIKRNPIKSERISSLAKLLRGQVGIAFENIALWHERDLTNSANERFTIPTTSILLDEMCESMLRVISNIVINRDRIIKNIDMTKGHIFAEFVMGALIQKGMSRMTAYRAVQGVAFEALKMDVHLRDALMQDSAISQNLSKNDLNAIFNPAMQLGASLAIIRNVSEHVKGL
ncbi:MAG: adenylosuccinate lyase [Cenarchaeum sp. SB0665_bin_23]|nr:adenylosuccinate lyase [Cenarchaeum sp. SB0664_bin_35]MXY61660.1 adenylosuccinate lyase [Cenarchaeum sp. SB0665_bin_23]MYB46119.1 adenylosuccinate lyase [Cenarchaeum sp. SB0662_bin_33]MYG33264.1 adenylosuccinate lyase [Cenarchaeum sp. SB0677_bin_16]